ncbi:MAG: hypothetical protein EHM40_18660 [Chloroflexi bacterium]|nr:MAG: hypothetical protein EHM40_18660 [Chloroflexota bacterium]
MPPAIEITLYGKDDEPIKTYERSIIPWGMLKKATRLMDQFEEPKPEAKKKWFWQKEEDANVRPEEKQMEAISQFVVDLFGNQFTVKELENGADMGEIMTVFRSVITRANAAVKSNPTISRSPKKT